MKTFSLSNRFAIAILAGSLAVANAFAQGDFEGSGEVPDPNCVGDGCGYVSADQAAPNEDEDNANYSYSDNGATTEEEPWPTSTEEPQADTTANTTASATATDTDSEEEDEAPEVATTNIDEEDDVTPHYIEENAADYRARKEGFSKGMQFGVRAQVGINKNLGSKASDWNIGPELGAGIMAKLPLGRSFAVSTELNFSFRHYGYEGKSEYKQIDSDSDEKTYSKNDATINEMLFEIPVIAQFVFDEDGFFIGVGANLGLKMSGDSENEQTINFAGTRMKETRSNTIPTVGVEVGALLDVGCAINRWLVLDLRVIQNFTNLLDLDLIAESSLMHSKLYTMHVGFGATFLL